MNYSLTKLFKIQGQRILDIFIDGRNITLVCKTRRKTACCPHCGRRTKRVHQYCQPQRVLHLILGEQRVYLSLRKRRFLCPFCQRVFTERLPFLEKRAKTTKLARQLMVKSLVGQSFKSVTLKTGVGYPSLRTWLEGMVNPFLLSWQEERKDKVIRLGIDEHYVKKGKFVTTVTNLARMTLKTILPDDRKQTLVSFLKGLPSWVKEKIDEVCCDMDQTIIRAVLEALPKARIVIDHFHLVKDANQRLNEARKIEQEMWKKRLPWKLFLKAKEHLREEERLLLGKILSQNSLLNTFYYYKEALREMYQLENKEEARDHLETTIRGMRATDNPELWLWAKSLKAHQEWILNYFDNRTTNAYTEGVHVKLKMLQRVSFGFRNIDVYIRKAMLACLPLAFIHHSYCY